ncbi:polysaccharide biosynthesis tyrosine autokinase [bacterium]|nr:polysaccharide biosynthesis tyrosine autokinase [bacterium]MBU1959342.1 polysaccharide biosynthesis tyrosine autokinase [bacterium]
MKSLPLHAPKEENYIIELFKIVLPYKWLILSVVVLSLLLAKAYLYFIPPTYESYALVKIKSDDTTLGAQDLLRDTLLKTNSAGIDQEILILQTYQMNQKALEKVNFQIRYFVDEGYKNVEIYEDVPISIERISDMSSHMVGQYITLIPKGDGFILKSEDNPVSSTYNYNKEVQTPYFRATFRKNRTFTEPIYIKVNGDHRHIYEDTIKKRLSVGRVDLNSNLIHITFHDTIPARANNYVNALIEAYIEQSIKKKNSINDKILKFLDEQLEVTKAELEVSERELENYQSKNKSIDPSVKSTNFFEKLSDVDLQLSEITLKEKLIHNLTQFIRHNRNLDAIAPTLLEFNDQSTIKLIDTLNALQAEEDELKLEFTDSYPRLIQIRQRMANIKNKVTLNIKNLASVLTEKRINLLNQKNKYEEILTALPKKEKKLISFKRNYEVKSKMYTYLLEKKSEKELIKVASLADYEAVDQAYTSSVPVKPKKIIILVIAFLIGFVLGVFFALLRFLTVDKVKTQKDVEHLTKLPIYGNIPLYKENLLLNVSVEEAYRKLAMNLQFFKKEDEGNVVLISSVAQGEGKTTTLVNLSKIFQDTRYRSIIIDLDMRNPSLHEHFGLEQQYSGISTYLNGRDNLGNVIFTTTNPNLDIITSGPTPPNPIELMLSPRLEDLLPTLKRRYDYIFIDTGSFDVALETFYLMQYSDINLIVFRENFSKKSSITDLEKLIREKNLKNIGLVLKTMPSTVDKNKPLPQLIKGKRSVKLLS